MIEVAQVKLREAGKTDYYATSGLKFIVGECVIVESDRGLEYGEVVSVPETVLDKKIATPLLKVIRKATQGDLYQIEKNKKRIEDIITTCERKIKERKLSMKLIDAEYSFDRSKIIFYFTADDRVDFRELVKDLAKIFKARIELKQIGVRDEAKIIDGYGPCGRRLCCAKFIKNFEPVTIKMAKDQNLPLNPTKISGCCGRLMCCLSYEWETYKQLMRGMPKVGEEIKVKQSKGKIISVNALRSEVTVELDDGRHVNVAYESGPCKKCDGTNKKCDHAKTRKADPGEGRK
ncbi:MAG: stage 0 sporulation family protein [Candidatus Omnitrophota bacterium]